MRRLTLILILAAGCSRSATVVGHLGGMRGPVMVAANGATVFAAAGDMLTIVDASDPARPRATASLKLNGHIHGVTADDLYAYALTAANTVVVVDRAGKVVRVVAADAPPNSTITSDGNHLYVAAGAHGLWIIDTSDRPRLHTLGRIDAPALDAAAAGNIVAVATGSAVGETEYMGGVALINMAAPEHPQATGSLSGLQLSKQGFSANVAHVALAGRTVFLSAPVSVFGSVTNYIAVVDATDISAPRAVTRVKTAEPPGPMLVRGDTLYVAGNPSLIAIDISNPSKPRVIGTTPLETQAVGNVAAGAGDVLYVGVADGVAVVRSR